MTLLGNAASTAYLVLFILCAVRYAALLAPRENRMVHISLGVTLALFAQMWLPALLAFAFEFTAWVQIAALVLFALPLRSLTKSAACC